MLSETNGVDEFDIRAPPPPRCVVKAKGYEHGGPIKKKGSQIRKQVAV